MEITLSKWGNSAAIRIPKKLLSELNIDDNNLEAVSFNVRMESGEMVLKKLLKKTKFELLAKKNEGKLNPKLPLDWGEPVGKEIW